MRRRAAGGGLPGVWCAWRAPSGGGGASSGRVGDASGAGHMLILATDQAAHGGHRPHDDGIARA